MTDTNYWVLPDGISESLPDEAENMEALRRQLIDTYKSWGYRFVMPPLVEYMASLRTGVGSLLDSQTFKISDHFSDRQLGIRADITPQVARMDAHSLKSNPVNRLCYIDRVLRTKSHHYEGSRSPLQVGAELFGSSGIESDCELISLMLKTLQTAGVEDIVLDIGHVDIFRSLSAQAELSESEEKHFFDMLSRKSIPEIDDWITSSNLSQPIGDMLSALPRLSGSVDVLDEAKTVLSSASRDVNQALDYLSDITSRLQENWPDITIHVDLSELRGYTYHTGIVYAAYVPGSGKEIARGGRYDDIGRHFGTARPATGFSTSLGVLLEAGNYQQPEDSAAIVAPTKNDAELNNLINQLRSDGEIVVRQLDDQKDDDCKILGCDRKIVSNNGKWSVVSL